MHTVFNGFSRVVLVIVAVGVTALSLSDVHAQPGQSGPLQPASPTPDREATEVLVLGTPHLGGHSDVFEPSMVTSLVEALDQFGPDAIAVEKVSGRQAAAMERWSGQWAKVAERFAGTFLYYGNRVRDRTGWSWSDANTRADSLLALAETDSLGAKERLSLVESLTAAYRIPSATLQWSALSRSIRTRQTRLSDTVATALTKRLTAANEVYSIGMRLARTRGHSRLYPIDHQAEKDLVVPFFRPLMKAIGDSMRQALDAQPLLQRADSLEEAGLAEGDLLPMYRYLNRDAVGRADVRTQWHTMLDVDLPNKMGRKWLALWEARNLHMVGHIRRVASQHPGGRILVITGSSHKPFFDAYLRQMIGVSVMDTDDVLPGS